MYDAINVILAQTLQAFRGDQLVASFFERSENYLIDTHYFDQPWYLVALGKAALSMAQGALRLGEHSLQRGLVVGKQATGIVTFQQTNILTLQAAHPVADEASLYAGQVLITFMQSLPPQARVLFLLSGGASALVEVLPSDWTLTRWQQQSRQWLISGWDIQRINQARRQISLIKGGKLLNYCPVDVQITQLMISDVQQDPIQYVASGLLYRPNDQRVYSYILADNHRLVSALMHNIALAGIACQLIDAYPHPQVDRLAVQIAQQAQAGRCYVYGGEPVVVLPECPPKGGRMQHLALSIAWQMRYASFPWLLIGVATDGSDGTTEVMRVQLNEQSIERAQQLGWDIAVCLSEFRAHDLLATLDVLTYCDHSDTNLNDVVVLFCGSLV